MSKDNKFNKDSSDLYYTDAPKFITRRKRGPGSAKGIDLDSKWVKGDDGIVSDAAQIATYEPIGSARYTVNSNTGPVGVPTIMACHYLPIPGASADARSPLSTAGQVLFQQIKKVINKPVTGYQFADPMIQYICYISMAVLALEVKRDMAVMNTYSTINLGVPQAILRASGYNPQAIIDLRSNMADYRQQYNLVLNEMSAIFAGRN